MNISECDRRQKWEVYLQMLLNIERLSKKSTGRNFGEVICTGGFLLEKFQPQLRHRNVYGLGQT